MAEGLASALRAHLRGGALFDRAMVCEIASMIDAVDSWSEKVNILMVYFEGNLGDRADFERVLTDYSNSALFDTFSSILRRRGATDDSLPDIETVSFLYISYVDECEEGDGGEGFADIMRSFLPEISEEAVEEVRAAFAESVSTRAESSSVSKHLLESSSSRSSNIFPLSSAPPDDSADLQDEIEKEDLKMVKKYVVQKYDEQVIYTKNDESSAGAGRREDINLINAVDRVNEKIRFRSAYI